MDEIAIANLMIAFWAIFREVIKTQFEVQIQQGNQFALLLESGLLLVLFIVTLVIVIAEFGWLWGLIGVAVAWGFYYLIIHYLLIKALPLLRIVALIGSPLVLIYWFFFI